MEGLHTLWDSTGIMGFVHAAQNAVADPNLHGFEQILHMDYDINLLVLAMAWYQKTI